MPEPSINASITKDKETGTLEKKILGGWLKLKKFFKKIIEQILRYRDGGNSHYPLTVSGEGQLFLRITTIIKLLFNY